MYILRMLIIKFLTIGQFVNTLCQYFYVRSSGNQFKDDVFLKYCLKWEKLNVMVDEKSRKQNCVWELVKQVNWLKLNAQLKHNM